jgi:hypothetical protein
VSDDTRIGWNSRSTHLQDGETQDQETVSFLDIQPCTLTEAPHSNEEVAESMAMQSVSLADFLSRPVKIHSTTWQESDSPGLKTSFYPWYNFFNTATIKYKLNNWGFIKCNMHVRVVYNASPFYYGSAMLNWRPLQNLSESYIRDDTTAKLLIPYSQMPLRTMIEPQCPTDAEVVLPFFWPVNFLRAEKAIDFQNVGTMYFNIINALQSANGVAGAGVTVNFYAWATDVVLSGPSVGLALQDGAIDEYSMDGPISKPASAIANIAARLGDIPVIGKFATATQIGFNAVGHIAKLFGFTNVPVIKDQKGVQPRALPPIASTDIGYPFEKLTVDSKNELTIDHRAVGLSADDELPIASIVQRESYLTSFDWTTSSAADALLFTSAVSPGLYDATNDTHQYLYMTPMCWLSTMFNYWRGDVIFRFRVVCSKYHRGRLKISFDPDGYSALNVTTDQSSHLIMTKMIDITEDTNVELRIPYQQYVAWCTSTAANTMTQATRKWGSSGFKHVRGATNGSLAVTVQTVLTAPIASSSISVQVFVRGAENMDFASPTTVGMYNLTPAIIQDGSIDTIDDSVKNQDANEIVSISSGQISSPIDHLYLTYMGERIASLRVLLRRQCKVFTYAPTVSTTADYMFKALSYPRVPVPYGFDANALDTAYGVLNVALPLKVNWTQGNFLSYIMPAFRGNKGSVNWTTLFDCGSDTGPMKSFTVVRDKGVSHPGYTTASATQGTTSTNANFFWAITRSQGAGASIATGQTSNAANWQMPFYSASKFAFNDIANLCNSVSEFQPNDCWTAEALFSNTYGCTPQAAKFHYYAGAGTDFDLLYFLHVPTYGVINTAPVPI